jgi:hypothetical protein
MIAAKPDAPIAICEGEKAADAGARIFNLKPRILGSLNVPRRAAKNAGVVAVAH